MGNTFYFSDALNIANRTMPRAVEDDTAAFVCNAGIAHIWKRYDWRESLNLLAPFWAQPLTQDYGSPFYAVPSDFYGLRLVYLVQVVSTPVTRWDLSVMKNPRKEYAQGLPTDIGYIPEKQCFRLWPVPPSGIAPTQWLIDGTYKMRPPSVTASTLQSTLIPFDDMYLMEVVSAIRWAAAKVSGSPQASTMLQELDYMIDLMATAEGIELGDQPIAPSESIFGQGEWVGYGAAQLGLTGLF